MRLLKKATDYANKRTRTEGKICSIAGLATTATVNDIENKTPNVNDLVKKTGYDTNISDFEKIFLLFLTIINFEWNT